MYLTNLSYCCEILLSIVNSTARFGSYARGFKSFSDIFSFLRKVVCCDPLLYFAARAKLVMEAPIFYHIAKNLYHPFKP